MKLLKIDRFQSLLRVVPETKDDLWHLSQVIESGDLVKGRTSRKIKGKEGEKTRREKLLLKIKVEKIEFNRFTGSLRVHGVIKEGKPAESIELGAMHSITVEQGKKLEIQKQKLRKDQVKRLKKAQKATHKKPVLVVVLDDESAGFALLKEFGFQEKGTIHSNKSGKQFEGGNWKKEYFGEITKKIIDSNTNTIVLAGPGFIKKELSEFLEKKNFEGKIFTENTNSVGLTGINELLKGRALARVVEDSEITREAKLMEKTMKEIGKGTGKAIYGLRKVKKAVEFGAVKELLVLDGFLAEKRDSLTPLMEKAESNNASTHIFNSEHDPGKKLKGIGKIAALLRYRVE